MRQPSTLSMYYSAAKLSWGDEQIWVVIIKTSVQVKSVNGIFHDKKQIP